MLAPCSSSIDIKTIKSFPISVKTTISANVQCGPLSISKGVCEAAYILENRLSDDGLGQIQPAACF